MKPRNVLFTLLSALILTLAFTACGDKEEEEITCTVTFDANGGIGKPPAPITQTHKRSEFYITLPEASDLSKLGHYFDEWIYGPLHFIGTEDGGVGGYPGKRCFISEDVTLYALWTPRYMFKTIRVGNMVETGNWVLMVSDAPPTDTTAFNKGVCAIGYTNIQKVGDTGIFVLEEGTSNGSDGYPYQYFGEFYISLFNITHSKRYDLMSDIQMYDIRIKLEEAITDAPHLNAWNWVWHNNYTWDYSWNPFDE